MDERAPITLHFIACNSCEGYQNITVAYDSAHLQLPAVCSIMPEACKILRFYNACCLWYEAGGMSLASCIGDRVH